jgi:hypothetical protein
VDALFDDPQAAREAVIAVASNTENTFFIIPPEKLKTLRIKPEKHCDYI